MKYFTLSLILYLILTVNFLCYGQEKSIDINNISYIELLQNEAFPKDFKNFLINNANKTIQFFELNKTFELIKSNDISILTRANAYGDIKVENMIRYSGENFSEYYPELKKYKLLPFATCIDKIWWRDDIVDFLAIIKCKDENFNNKIIYIDCHYNNNRPVIIKNSIYELIDFIGSLDNKKDTIFSVKSKENLINGFELSKAELQKKNLVKKKKKSNFSNQYTEVTIKDTLTSEKTLKLSFNIEYFDGKNLFSQEYIFNDLNKKNSELSGYYYQSVFFFLQKALIKFRESLGSKSSSFQDYMKTVSVNDLLRCAYIKRSKSDDLLLNYLSAELIIEKEELKVRFSGNLNGEKKQKEYNISEILANSKKDLIPYIIKKSKQFAKESNYPSLFVESISLVYISTIAVKEYESKKR